MSSVRYKLNMAIRHGRRNHRIVLALLFTIIFLVLRMDSKSAWQSIKETFKDDDFNDYKQLSSIDINKNQGDGAIDLSKIFVSGVGEQDISFIPLYERANATFYTVVRNNQMEELLKTVQSVEARFNNKFHYDWVFMHSRRINSISKSTLLNLVSGDTLFYKIPKEQWGFPDGVDRRRASRLRRKYRVNQIITGLTDLLRFQLRFQAGLMQDSPPMSQYRYYMRVDPGVEFQCDVDEDFFHLMQSQDKKFGFTRAGRETGKLVETLWSNVQNFLLENPSIQPPNNLAVDFLVEDGDYNGCYVSNDLEILDLNFLRSDAYRDFFNYLDSSHGWFYERWTDYHMHTLLSLFLLDKNDLKLFNIGHKAEKFTSCALSDMQYLASKCYCETSKDQTFKGDTTCMMKLISIVEQDDTVRGLKKIGSRGKLGKWFMKDIEEKSPENNEEEKGEEIVDESYNRDEPKPERDDYLSKDESELQKVEELKKDELNPPNIDELNKDEPKLPKIEELNKDGSKVPKIEELYEDDRKIADLNENENKPPKIEELYRDGPTPPKIEELNKDVNPQILTNEEEKL